MFWIACYCLHFVKISHILGSLNCTGCLWYVSTSLLLTQGILIQFVDMIYELQRTIIDWEYVSEPSRRYTISSSNGLSWPRGLVLGGSGTINAMKYVRGNKRDYDHWEQLGNKGWSWDEVLGYFKKSEDNKVGKLVQLDQGKWHSTGGYLSVDYNDISDPMNNVLMEAAKEVGFEELDDLNADKHIGYGQSVFTIVNATRCSPAKAFLSPVRYRKNMHVIKHAFVTSIIFEQLNEARGVNFILQNQATLRAFARKEVIVSTGTVNTPKLLQLSGIGRNIDLDPFKIVQRANLNVGYNLQDHVAIPLFVKLKKSTAKPVNIYLEKIINLYNFLFKDRRQSTRNHDVSGVTILANTINVTDPYPDVHFEYILFKKGGISSILITRSFGFNEDVVESVHRAELEADVLLVRIHVLKPFSRGKVTLKSTDPYVDPLIKANYFNDYEDLKTLIRAIRIQQQMLTTDALRKNEAELHKIHLPACMFILHDSDEYWECYIRHLTLTLYHPAGTAKMGPSSDPEAVVDERLRVRNTTRLRVVDASIMPYIVSANLNAPTIMIGEKGADFIKEDNGF